MPRLFAVNAEGIDSEKAGEALLNSLIPGLKPGASESDDFMDRPNLAFNIKNF